MGNKRRNKWSERWEQTQKNVGETSKKVAELDQNFGTLRNDWLRFCNEKALDRIIFLEKELEIAKVNLTKLDSRLTGIPDRQEFNRFTKQMSKEREAAQGTVKATGVIPGLTTEDAKVKQIIAEAVRDHLNSIYITSNKYANLEVLTLKNEMHQLRDELATSVAELNRELTVTSNENKRIFEIQRVLVDNLDDKVAQVQNHLTGLDMVTDNKDERRGALETKVEGLYNTLRGKLGDNYCCTACNKLEAVVSLMRDQVERTRANVQTVVQTVHELGLNPDLPKKLYGEQSLDVTKPGVIHRRQVTNVSGTSLGDATAAGVLEDVDEL